MAEENTAEQTEGGITMAYDTHQNALTLGLAMLAGTGLILMISAGGLGVIEGAEADMDIIGLLFTGGLALFISGIVAWAGVVRPWENFDDINVPHYTGHHHDEDHHAEDEADDTRTLTETTASNAS